MDMQRRCTIIPEQVSRIRPQLESMQEPGKATDKYPMKGVLRSSLMAQQLDK